MIKAFKIAMAIILAIITGILLLTAIGVGIALYLKKQNDIKKNVPISKTDKK